MKVLLALYLMLLISGSNFAHVALDSPTGGEYYDPNQVVNISWHILVDHPQENWDLFFSTDGGSTWQDLALDLPSSQLSYGWTVPDVVTSQARIKVVMDNVAANYQAESEDFAIGVYRPLILNYPMGGEVFLPGSIEQITWKVNDPVTFDGWNLFFSDDGGSNWSALAEDLSPATLLYNWIVPMITTDQARIKLEMNIGGTIYKDISGVFTISNEVVTAILAVEEQANNLQVYPNPFSQSVSFEITFSNSSILELTVYSQTGQLVFIKSFNKISSSPASISWHPKGISSGIYYYQLQSNLGIQAGKLVYQK